MLIYLFPSSCAGSRRAASAPAHLVMPSIVLAAFYSARIARLTRSTVLDALKRTTCSDRPRQGARESRVIGKHTLRNSAIPIVTLAGSRPGSFIGGAVITETIFAWPGLGRLTVQALLNRDFPLVLAAVSFTSIVYTLLNLLVDLAYGWLDPRMRVKGVKASSASSSRWRGGGGPGRRHGLHRTIPARPTSR